MDISEGIKDVYPKHIGLFTELRKINKKLPAAVYIPFFESNLFFY